MPLEEAYIGFLNKIPGIADPIQRLNFKDKLKWTGLILLVYFIMGQIPVFGVADVALEQFKILEIILGSSFGSIMTLGIGPIVTASIILQLLVGSKIIPWDLTSENGRAMFQGTQKLLGILFSFLEAATFVFFGALPASAPNLVWLVVVQIAAGGILVVFMDELISKWGFGSGVGLFIVAGVSKSILITMINPLTQAGGFPNAANPPSGYIPFALTALGVGEVSQAMLALLPVIATVLVFLLVIYANAIKVEIPLAFGSIRGFGRRWPLQFFYTSNIPVILIAALLANVNLMARMLADKGMSWLGTFSAEGSPTGGLIYFVTPPRSDALSGFIISIGIFALLGVLIAYFTKKSSVKFPVIFGAFGGVFWYILALSTLPALTYVPPIDMLRALIYSLFMIGGSVVFSIFWVATSGMDAKSVAEQIQSTGMQIPGYRRDVRIIERVLDRYIPGLAVLGGAAVGFLAAYADFTGALGIGILLATMIVYQLYEEIAAQHMEDMHPAIRKMLGK